MTFCWFITELVISKLTFEKMLIIFGFILPPCPFLIFSFVRKLWNMRLFRWQEGLMSPEACLIFHSSTTWSKKWYYFYLQTFYCAKTFLFIYLKYTCVVQRRFAHVHCHILYNTVFYVMSYPLGEEKKHSFPWKQTYVIDKKTTFSLHPYEIIPQWFLYAGSEEYRQVMLGSWDSLNIKTHQSNLLCRMMEECNCSRWLSLRSVIEFFNN